MSGSCKKNNCQTFYLAAAKFVAERGLIDELCMPMAKRMWKDLTFDEKMQWTSKHKKQGTKNDIANHFKPRHIALMNYSEKAYPIIKINVSEWAHIHCMEYMWATIIFYELETWLGPIYQFEKYKILVLFLQAKNICIIRDIQYCIMEILFKINTPLTPIITKLFV